MNSTQCIMKELLVPFFLTLLFSCATVKTEIHPVNLLQKVYTFDKNHVAINEIDETIKKEISKAVTKSDYWPYKKEKYLNIFAVSGLKLQTGLNSFDFVYANGSIGSEGSTVVSTTTFTLQKHFQESEKYYEYKLVFLPDAKAINTPAPLWGYEKQLAPVNVLADDIRNNIFPSIGDIQFIKYKQVKGEINSQFPSESIFANFARLLGPYTDDQSLPSGLDIKKDKIFKFSPSSSLVNAPIKVEVYPYRNGSKVLYELYIPYKVLSDGTITLRTGDATLVESEVARIIND